MHLKIGFFLIPDLSQPAHLKLCPHTTMMSFYFLNITTGRSLMNILRDDNIIFCISLSDNVWYFSQTNTKYYVTIVHNIYYNSYALAIVCVCKLYSRLFKTRKKIKLSKYSCLNPYFRRTLM